MVGVVQIFFFIGFCVECYFFFFYVFCFWVRIGEGRGFSGSVFILYGNFKGIRIGFVIFAFIVFFFDDQNNDYDVGRDDESKDDDINRNVNIFIVCFRFFFSDSGIINGYFNIKLGIC